MKYTIILMAISLIALSDAVEAGKPIDPALENKLNDAIDAVAQLDGGAADRLSAYASQRLCAYIEDPMSSRLVLRALTSDGADNDIQQVRDDFARNFNRPVDLIRAGQASGQLRADLNPALVALMM